MWVILLESYVGWLNLIFIPPTQFERGTISYVISSTITRPTSIASTTSCDTKVAYRENIDVGLFSIPITRVVILDPIVPVFEPKAPAKTLKATLATSRRQSYTSPTSRTNRFSRTPDSTDSPIEGRSTRTTSPSAVSFRSGAAVGVQVSPFNSEPQSSQSSRQVMFSDNTANKIISDLRTRRTISMSVELSRSGCLPGEIVPLTVSVKHTKVIQSLNGIIVTLYRIGHVDMHPDIPLGTTHQNDKVKQENLYPRSRTGLGGLSLTAAGSSQIWRKELSQTFAPLYIDHHTMSAQVKLAVRVPDDAFPSIQNAPGQMISFKYYVEVIVDIHGKMTDPDLNYPSLSVTGVQSQMPNGGPIESLHSVTTWGANCIDTTQIRAARWSMTCDCDLVVGTRDSARERGKREKQDLNQPYAAGAQEEYSVEVPETNNVDGYENYAYESYDGNGYVYTDYYDSSYGNGAPYDYGHDYDYDNYQYQNPRYNLPNVQYYPPVPLPIMPEEDDLSEKERAWRAEARLLPSQPPADDGPSAGTIEQAPTAPFLPNEGDFDSSEAYRRAVDQHHYGSNHQRGFDLAIHRQTLQMTEHARADLCHASNVDVMQVQQGASSDDKQELERRRLQFRASGPEASPGSLVVEASAPHADVMDEVAEVVPRSREEDDLYSRTAQSNPGLISGFVSSARESLPQYER